MNKSLFKIIIVFFVFSLLSVLKSFAYDVNIAADSIEYDEKNGKISAEGNVIIDWQDRKVYAEYADFFIDKKIMNAHGSVKIENSGNIICADSIAYDYDSKTGDMNESFWYSSSLFIRVKHMGKRSKDVYTIRDIKISNCDLDGSHTCFVAKRGKLTLNKRITLYWPVFYIGKIPVLALPIVTRSLKERKSFASDFKVVLEPGSSSYGGIFLRTKALCSLGKSSSLEVIYDYLGIRGSGYGGKFDCAMQNANGDAYVYFTNDLLDDKKKYAIRSYYQQKINDKWTVQSQAEFINDNNFNNCYNQSDRRRIMDTLYSYACVTRQGRNTNLNMLVSRRDNYNNDAGDYNIATTMLPQVKFTYYPKSIFWAIIHGFDVNCARDYRNYKNEFFYKNNGIFNYNITKPIIFGKRLTLKPSLGISENWADKDDDNNAYSAFVSRYSGNFNSRLRTTGWMDWNVSYSLKARMDKNSLCIDSSEEDCGIEINQVSFANSMYLDDRISAKNAVSYNLKRYKENNISISNRILPLITEITWTPRYYIFAYVKQSQFLEPFEFKDLTIYLKMGNFEKAYFNLGTFYQKYDDWQMNNVLGFGLWPTPKWRVDYNIRTSLFFNLSRIEMREHEIRLYRDAHCYNIGVICRIRENSHEEFLKLNIKTNMSFNRKIKNIDYQDPKNIFYPWKDRSMAI